MASTGTFGVAGAVATAVADTRFNFTGQHLAGAAIFARKAHEIARASTFSDETIIEHRAYVWSAIVQSATALEAHVAEIFMHGPGHHLGSNGTNTKARDLLQHAWETEKYKTGVLTKYQSALKIIGRPSLNEQSGYYKAADLLLRTRNELVHYKSKWGSEMQNDTSPFEELEKLKLAPPPFTAKDQNFFPHRCLSASFASWSVETGTNFINELYKHLQISSPLLNHAIKVPPPETI